MANRCAQREESLSTDVETVKYSRDERLGIIACVAKDTGSEICVELLEMLSLSLNDADVAELLNTQNIKVTFEPIEEIPAKVNLRKDQEYALIAGIQLGVRDDFCMRQIIKHYHNRMVALLKSCIPASEANYVNEITDEVVWEMISRYFDMRTNNSLLSMLKVAAPRKVLRSYMYREPLNGVKIPEKRYLLMMKVKKYFADNGVDLERFSNKEMRGCIEYLKANGYDITMPELSEIVCDFTTQAVPLSSEAYVDVLEKSEAEAITDSTVSLKSMISAELKYFESQTSIMLSAIMDKELTSDEKYVIFRYRGLLSGEKITRTELAEYMGVELKQLMAIERRAMNKLRKSILREAPELAEFSY